MHSLPAGLLSCQMLKNSYHEIADTDDIAPIMCISFLNRVAPLVFFPSSGHVEPNLGTRSCESHRHHKSKWMDHTQSAQHNNRESRLWLKEIITHTHTHREKHTHTNSPNHTNSHTPVKDLCSALAWLHAQTHPRLTHVLQPQLAGVHLNRHCRWVRRDSH